MINNNDNNNNNYIYLSIYLSIYLYTCRDAYMIIHVRISTLSPAGSSQIQGRDTRRTDSPVVTAELKYISHA